MKMSKLSPATLNSNYAMSAKCCRTTFCVHPTNVLHPIAAIWVARRVREDDPQAKVGARIHLESITNHVEFASHFRPEKKEYTYNPYP